MEELNYYKMRSENSVTEKLKVIENPKEDVVLFGASEFGKNALPFLKKRYNILYFCDNDRDKWGQKIEGIEIISPNQLKTLKNPKVIITSIFYSEIISQLIKLDINNIDWVSIDVKVSKLI